MTLTKAALVRRLASQLKISTRSSGEIVDAFFGQIRSTLVCGEGVKLHSFGRFAVKVKRGRNIRHARTRLETTIKRRRIVTFNPSKVLLANILRERK
jgi:integration host factor subunit alpha